MDVRKPAGREEPRIGIYVRESRDDNEKKLETIETQRDLLLEFAAARKLGMVAAVYMDDNVSGSSFDRKGINRLRRDVEARKLDIILVKDLSRLGRSNSKTLLFLDFLEDNGVRVITGDSRYDSLRDDEMLGIETWANERYVRDISRKIRSSLRFKIERGEYLGHAPYGYRKSKSQKNRLEVDPDKGEYVRKIFQWYRQGYGYSSIAALLNREGIPSPAGLKWSSPAVRRILCSSVYVGETVQGVSERISFKSRKARRLPPEKQVVTPGTHEALISREEFGEVQQLRESKRSFAGPHKQEIHLLRGLLYCGGCGSALYARKRAGDRLAYVCGSYLKKGSSACSSHLIYEETVVEELFRELERMATLPGMEQHILDELRKYESAAPEREDRINALEKQLRLKLKQKEMAYDDRLEGRIDLPLYEKTKKNLEDRISIIKEELNRLSGEECPQPLQAMTADGLLDDIRKRYLTNELVRGLVDRIIVLDPEDGADLQTEW